MRQRNPHNAHGAVDSDKTTQHVDGHQRITAAFVDDPNQRAANPALLLS